MKQYSGEEKQEILHKPFNIETHKEAFVYYLEVIIDKDGIVHYAVPSHNGVLEMLLLKMRGIEFDDFDFYGKVGDLCPRNRWFDYPEWLCEETGCIMVWGIPNSHIIGVPNDNQLKTLELLKKEGLF